MQVPHNAQTPALVQMMQWIGNPFAVMERCASQYGDVFALPVGDRLSPIVFVHHPEALQEILSNDTKQFSAPGELNQTFLPFLGTNSLILLSGAAHRRQRQLLMPPFHGERMRSYGQAIRDITQQVMQTWQPGQPFSARLAMQTISMRVILKTIFGLTEGLRYQQLETLVGAIMDGMSSPLGAALLYFPALQRDVGPLSPWSLFLRRRQQIDDLIYAEIQDRRDHPDASRTDILAMLMAARDEAGQPMTDVELRDELMTLLTAGHETTATAMTWALYWIHKLPEVKARLLKELADLGPDPDPTAVMRLPYLSAVCSETLRIYPVGMLTFPRVPQRNCNLMGYELEAGTLLLGCIYLLHQRPDLYPEPRQFRPERFLERQFSPYEFMPFGGGSRRCIGMAFALFEMQVALATMLSQAELSLASQRSVKPIRRGLVSGPSTVDLVLTGNRLSASAALPTLAPDKLAMDKQTV